MKSLKFYKYFALIMLLLNIAVIAFIAFSKPKHGNHSHQKKGPPPMLNLTDSQVEKFELLADQHKSEMRRIMKEQKQILNAHFRTLYTNELELNDNDLSGFYNLEKKKINSTYSHFEDVKKLLDEDQLRNYQEFVEKTIGHIFSNRRKRDRRRK